MTASRRWSPTFYNYEYCPTSGLPYVPSRSNAITPKELHILENLSEEFESIPRICTRSAERCGCCKKVNFSPIDAMGLVRKGFAEYAHDGAGRTRHCQRFFKRRSLLEEGGR